MSDHRCDVGLPNGKRCRNDATAWVHCTINLTGEVEHWPLAVCDAHARPPDDGVIRRMGPDRRAEYAAPRSPGGEETK
jgi:hypothetical protein